MILLLLSLVLLPLLLLVFTTTGDEELSKAGFGLYLAMMGLSSQVITNFLIYANALLASSSLLKVTYQLLFSAYWQQIGLLGHFSLSKICLTLSSGVSWWISLIMRTDLLFAGGFSGPSVCTCCGVVLLAAGIAVVVVVIVIVVSLVLLVAAVELVVGSFIVEFVVLWLACVLGNSESNLNLISSVFGSTSFLSPTTTSTCCCFHILLFCFLVLSLSATIGSIT